MVPLDSKFVPTVKSERAVNEEMAAVFQCSRVTEYAGRSIRHQAVAPYEHFSGIEPIFSHEPTIDQQTKQRPSSFGPHLFDQIHRIRGVQLGVLKAMKAALLRSVFQIAQVQVHLSFMCI